MTHLDELGEDETGGAGSDQEHLGAERHLELVHSVDGARRRLEERGLLVREVLDLVALGEVAVNQRKPQQPSWRTYYLMYSAKPPSRATPAGAKCSQKSSWPFRQ